MCDINKAPQYFQVVCSCVLGQWCAEKRTFFCPEKDGQVSAAFFLDWQEPKRCIFMLGENNLTAVLYQAGLGLGL